MATDPRCLGDAALCRARGCSPGKGASGDVGSDQSPSLCELCIVKHLSSSETIAVTLRKPLSKITAAGLEFGRLRNGIP